MLDLRSLERTLEVLLQDATQFDTETLENIVTNCKNEIGILSSKDDSYYIELVCKTHAYALVELSKR